MGDVLHTPICLERADLRRIAVGENLIDVLNDRLNIRRAVLGHKLVDDVEVPQKVSVCADVTVFSTRSGGNGTHTIDSTTADEA